MESRTQALLTCGLSVLSGLQHARCNAQSPKDVFWRWEQTHRATLPQEKTWAYWTSLSLTYKPSLQEIRSSVRTMPNCSGTTGTNTFIDQIQGVCPFCTSDNCGILCRKLPGSWMWRMCNSPWSERLLGRIESALGRKRQTKDLTRLGWTPHPIAFWIVCCLVSEFSSLIPWATVSARYKDRNKRGKWMSK